MVRYYNATGAGTTAWDGQYTLTKRTMGGGPVYESDSEQCPNGLACSLYSNGGVWRLASLGRELFYVAGSKTGTTSPALLGWGCANGTAPAPTLVAGPK
jgi:hypothetical protein